MGNDMDKRVEWLLKSSLILEHQVAAIIAESGFHNQGEFSYTRANEQGIDTDFSADLLASAEINMGDTFSEPLSLGVLIECKYASPSVEWVFSKMPGYEPTVYSALSVFNWLGSYVVKNSKSLNALESPIYCNRGVSLSSSSADPKSIKHGLQQLRYALPSLLQWICTIFIGSEEGMPIPVLGALLVTNAPIRVLKDDICVEQASNYKVLDEITTTHSVVGVYQTASTELKLVCDKIARAVSEVLGVDPELGLEDMVRTSLIDCVETVTVVSLETLPTYLKEMRSAMSRVELMSRQDFAQYYRDIGKKK